jgi:hypothetical protein
MKSRAELFHVKSKWNVDSFSGCLLILSCQHIEIGSRSN